MICLQLGFLKRTEGLNADSPSYSTTARRVAFISLELTGDSWDREDKGSCPMGLRDTVGGLPGPKSAGVRELHLHYKEIGLDS